MVTLHEPDPRRLAEAWRAVDPSPDNRSRIDELLDGDDEGLVRSFGKRLQFGTAGLRGPLGPGPMAMNRVLVRVVASALATRLGRETGEPHVVVGYDARHGSRDFAHDTARVLAAQSVRVSLFDRVTPTPVLAFAVRHLGATAGVMVTASHNPRSDNGYKVYWSDGSQIGRPIDSEISALIDEVSLVGDDALVDIDDRRIAQVGAELIAEYSAAINGLLHAGSRRTTRVAYTPLHGVGREVLEQAFAQAGFPPPVVVAEQGTPDPDFATTGFPNPEEPGSLDLVLRDATIHRCDLALANDPDADRLAVAVPVGPAWRLLSGDELGCVIAEYLLARADRSDGVPLVVNTVVSSRLLSRLAARHDAVYEQTLTGFKWVMTARDKHPGAPLLLGYEEALGYAVGTVVGDKDGISAALVVAEMAAELAAEGRTLLDLLDEIHRREGVHVTGQRSLRFEAAAPTPGDVVDGLRLDPPWSFGPDTIATVVDLALGSDALPPTDGLIYELDQARIIVRPSGTEAKLKIYGEVWTEPNGDAPAARIRLQRLLDAAASLLADPERRRGGTSGHEATGGDTTATRAAELFAQVPSGFERSVALRNVIRCIELTTLAGDDTPGRIRALCAQARRPDPADPTIGPTAAVCVYPSLVGLAVELNAGTSIRSASVAGAFPSGLSPLAVRLHDIDVAIAAGADDVDVVLNRSAFLSGNVELAARELREMRDHCGSTTMKVIIEVDDLGSLHAVREATIMAIDAGADWVKTSTGKTGVGATPAAALAMAETIAAHPAPTGTNVGLKISGGVRTADDALGYVAIVSSALGAVGVTPARLRFGASGLVAAVVADLAVTEDTLR